MLMDYVERRTIATVIQDLNQRICLSAYWLDCHLFQPLINGPCQWVYFAIDAGRVAQSQKAEAWDVSFFPRKSQRRKVFVKLRISWSPIPLCRYAIRSGRPCILCEWLFLGGGI